MSAEKIYHDWKSKSYKSVYWLQGEEDYFIDKLADYAEHQLIPEGEAAFNKTVFYGRDTNWSDLVNACMRYPMLADKQMVLLKEAQHMREIEKLENYIEKPLDSTILIVCYKGKSIDKRTRLAKLLQKNAQIFSSEKIKDYKLEEWVADFVRSQHFTMSRKAVALLAQHLGNNLSRIVNEIEKVTVNLGGRTTITEEDIENFVGVSKDYNAFELQEALSRKDLPKALQIIQYFESNPKAGPIQMILPALYGYFSRVYALFGLKVMSEEMARPIFYNNSFAARDAVSAARKYQLDGLEKVLLLLHEYNLRSLGINDAGTSDAELMKELAVKIMNC